MVTPRPRSLRPVAGRPLPLPVLVPSPVHKTVTRSSSQTIRSMVMRRSGTAARQPRAASWSSARPTSRFPAWLTKSGA